MNKILTILDAMLDPATWTAGIVCLSAAGFTRSQACGYAILGGLLLATPVAPKLLRCLIGRLPESRNR